MSVFVYNLHNGKLKTRCLAMKSTKGLFSFQENVTNAHSCGLQKQRFVSKREGAANRTTNVGEEKYQVKRGD